MKHLLLLGAGHAHLHVLRDLARLPLAPAARVTLVTPHARFLHPGMLPGWVAGRCTLEACSVALAPLLEAARVEWVESAPTALDAARRQVQLAGGATLDYDVLSIDTGCVAPRDAIEGARDLALFTRPLQQMVPLWERVVELAAQRPLGVVVIGGAAGGVELALAMERRLGPASRVSLVTGAAGLLPGLPAGARRHATAQLRRRRISVLQADALRVEPTHVVLANGTRLVCDAPVVALPGVAPPWLARSGLAVDAQGCVLTGPRLQSLSHPPVFAVGDVAVRPDAPQGQPALPVAAALAGNLRLVLAGAEPRVHRPGRHTLVLLACGDGSAIGAWGPLSGGGRWVGRWKDRIDRAFIHRYSQLPPRRPPAGVVPGP